MQLCTKLNACIAKARAWELAIAKLKRVVEQLQAPVDSMPALA